MSAGVDTNICFRVECEHVRSFEVYKYGWWGCCGHEKVTMEAFPYSRRRVDNDIIPDTCPHKNIMIASSNKQVKTRCICED